jgi:hypothetical protein
MKGEKMAMSPEMRRYTNRNRVIGVTQKHEREWTPCESRLIQGYGQTFLNELDSRITVDFLSLGFIAIKWSLPPWYHSWAIAPYEGKMYRNLVTMSSNLVRNRTRGNSQIIYGSSLIPMERLLVDSTMYSALRDALLYRESASILPSNWDQLMIFPDSVIVEVSRRVGYIVEEEVSASVPEPEQFTVHLGPEVPVEAVSNIGNSENPLDLTVPLPESNSDVSSEDEIEYVPNIPIRKIRV